MVEVKANDVFIMEIDGVEIFIDGSDEVRMMMDEIYNNLPMLLGDSKSIFNVAENLIYVAQENGVNVGESDFSSGMNYGTRREYINIENGVIVEFVLDDKDEKIKKQDGKFDIKSNGLITCFKECDLDDRMHFLSKQEEAADEYEKLSKYFEEYESLTKTIEVIKEETIYETLEMQ